MDSPSTSEATEPSRGPLAWMARNSVAANLLMILLLVGGLAMLPRIRQEVLPSFELDMLGIQVAYPGASPEEVEQGIVLATEESVRGVDGVKRVTSVASEGQALLTVELLLGADPDRVLADVEAAVDRISSYPADAERPVVSIVSRRNKVVSLIVSGVRNEQVLRNLAEQARRRLLQSPEITQIELRGAREREISIEVSQAQLRRFGLTLGEVAQAVRQASVDVPGGAIRTDHGEILVRTVERRDTAREFEDVVVRSTQSGAEVHLGDLAHVEDDFRDEGVRAQFDGLPAIMLDVFRVGDQTPVGVADAVREAAAELRAAAPAGVRYAVWDDSSEAFEGRRDLMVENAAMGFLLVLLILGLFLDLRLAFWVTAGIPISFIGSMLVFPSFDVSVNMISMFAFIVALGMVVDDAIVAGESIYQRRQAGDPPLRAAIEGIREVAAPVTFSVLSTIIAFTPLLFVPGVGGKFMRNVPLIVIAVLLISLVESLFILPAHLAHTRNAERGVLARLERKQRAFAAMLERFVERVYQPVLRAALRRRYLTLACGLSLLIASVGVIAGGRVAFSFLPKIDSDLITVSARLPFGAPLSNTREVADHIERSARRVLGDAGGFDALARGIYTELGESGDHVANLTIQLTPSDQRDISASELSRRMREAVGDLPGVTSLRFEYTAKGGPPGRPVDVELSHDDMDVLQSAASQLALGLQQYAGVIDVDSGVTRGKPQLDFTLTPLARAAGLDAQAVGQQLRSAFYGQEVVRQQRGRDEVRVVVRRPERERRSESDIERTLLRAPDGTELPLMAAAQVDRRRSYTQIERRDGRRLIHVTADVDDEVTSASRVLADVEADQLPALSRTFEGLSFEIGGAKRSEREANGALGVGFVMAMFAIFALLAIPFRSYWQPLVVLGAIPFGFVGAVFGHWLMGFDLSLMSMMGLVALSGVVVNDSLVLVVGVNEGRSRGLSLTEALVHGSMRRFRPILLTSLTTFFGLAPMLTETSVQARFIIPMAISLAFGVMSATFITLLIVPASYAVCEDLLAAARWVLGKDAPAAPPRRRAHTGAFAGPQYAPEPGE